MSFKYINPGYAEFLDVAGGTTIADTVKSKTGMMFYQPTDKKGLELSETPAELYGKFDVYIPKNRNDFWIKIAMLETNGYALDGMGFVKRDNVMYFLRYYSGNSSGGTEAYLSEQERLNLKLNAINTIWFHVKTGTDGYVQIYANGQSVEKFDYDIKFGKSKTLVVYADSAYGAISNLILSDTEIDPKEQVVLLPIATTETTMAAGEDGEYIADTDGQTILQSIDTESLIRDYGADTLIKGIAVMGNPVCRTAEGLSNLTAIQSDGVNITEYGTKIAPQGTPGIVLNCQYAKASADTSRVLSMNFCVRRSECLRQIRKTEIISADTIGRLGIDGLSMADTSRKLGWGEPAVSHTRRQVIKFQLLLADTSIRVPVVLAYVEPLVKSSRARKIKDVALPSIMDNFREHGIRSFSMSLGELTLSDSFQLETVQPLNIDDSVQGQIFDYHFHFLVEETSQRDLVQTVKGMYSKDKLLYSAISFFVNEFEVSYYADGIAKALGLKLDMACDDFIPSQNFEDSGMTYQDFISSLFGWTSKLPQRQINVFIRGDTLHIIQRGRERSVVDITYWPHGRPTIERKLVRSIWHSTMENAGKAHNDEDTEPKGFTGTISLGEISRSYSNGFLTHETNEKGYTDYVYDGEYLSEKSTHNKDGSTSRTEYFYAKTNRDIYLFEEKERTTEPIDDGQEHDIYDWTDWNNKNGTERITYHAPLGYGWYSTVVYVDGELEGSSLSQGKPGGKASRFTIDQSNLSLGADYDMGDDDDGPKYESLIDTEFPVIGENYLWELTKAIEWLNRKTQETVTVEILANIHNGVPDVKHIVDFTERVKFNGSEYFLVSNVVELTPRSLRQTIKMTRWY